MTRKDLLQYIQSARAKRRSLTGGMALALLAWGLWGCLRLTQGYADGWVYMLTAPAPGVGLWLRALESAPTYIAGALQARRVWWRSLMWCAGLALFILGGFTGFWAWQNIAGLVCGFGGLLLTVFLLLQIPGLFRTGPTLVVDSQGVYDKRLMRRQAAWDEVVSFDVIDKGATVFYRLTLRDLDAFNWSSRLSAWFGGRGVRLNCLDLTCGPGDLLLAVNTHRPSLLGEWPVSVAA